MKLSISRRKSKLVVLMMYYALHYNLKIFEFSSISWCSLRLDFPRKRRTQARNLPSDSKVPIQGRCKIASPAWDFYSSWYLSICQTDLADSKSHPYLSTALSVFGMPLPNLWNALVHSTHLLNVFSDAKFTHVYHFHDELPYNTIVYIAFRNKHFYVKEQIFICG